MTTHAHCARARKTVYPIRRTSRWLACFSLRKRLRYCRACDLCEQVVVVNAEHHRLLRLLLIYDRSKGGFKVRVLSKDYPQLGLLALDRLGRSASLPNIHGRRFRQFGCFSSDSHILAWLPGRGHQAPQSAVQRHREARGCFGHGQLARESMFKDGVVHDVVGIIPLV